MERVLVTGGLGFLGSRIAQALVANGHPVRILARERPDERRAAPPGAEVLFGDARDPAMIERALVGVGSAVNTVSNFRRGGSDRHEARSINVDAARLLAEAASRCGLRRLVHCSTIGVHGSVREIPADEATPFNPGDLYQETKVEGEIALREVAARTALELVVLRPISIYGPGDTRMLKLFRAIKRRRFVMIGSGAPLFQPAYVDDVVDGFMLALEHPRAAGESFIVGGDEYLSLSNLVRMIAEEAGVAPPRLRIPLTPVRWLATACEALCAPLWLEPPLHRRRVSFFTNDRAFRIDKARRMLGYEPRVKLRDGIRKTLAWYEEQGWL